MVSSRNHEELGHAAPPRIMVWDGRDRPPEPTVGKAGGGLGPEIFSIRFCIPCTIEDSTYKGSAVLGHGVRHGGRHLSWVCTHQALPERMSLILTVPFIYFCRGPHLTGLLCAHGARVPPQLNFIGQFPRLP